MNRLPSSLHLPGARRLTENSGFTLIELMVTVVIVAIIVSFAIPSYTRWVIKANRAEGKIVTMQTAQTLERCFTRFNSYDDDSCSLGNGDSVTSENGKFNVTVASNDTTFTLTATPVQTDSECLTLTLTHLGVRGNTGTGAVEDCW